MSAVIGKGNGCSMPGLAAKVLLWLMTALAAMTTQAQTTVEYIHTDALGTPVAVTDAAGNVIERSEYAPYGELLNRPLTDGPGYTGHVQDAATGLTYMQQRYYDPQIGRFLSVDPVAADSSNGALFNRYMYAANNPYRFFDPDGRCTGSRIENSDGTCVSTGENTATPTAASGGLASSTVPKAPHAHAELNRSMLAPKSDSTWEKLTSNGNILDMESLGHDVFYPLMDSPEGAPIKAGLMIVKVGRAGENAVRAAYSIGEKGFFRVGFRVRFPDGLTATTISEIKNVKSLSYTSQLRDYTDFAKSTGRTFDLYVRPSTMLSGPLVEAVRAGDISLKFIP